MKALDRFIKGDMHGIHYAVSIFFATVVLWLLVHKLAKANPVWAISSMVATSDPLMKQAVLFLRSRIINTLVGCGVGLLFIAIGGTRLIMLPLALKRCGGRHRSEQRSLSPLDWSFTPENTA